MFGDLETYQTKKKLKVFPGIFPGSGTVILLIAIALLFGITIWWVNHNASLQNIWTGYSPDEKGASSICEKTNMSNPVQQPVNTFSSIVYLLVAIVVLKNNRVRLKAIRDSKYFSTASFYSLIFGILLIYVFGASVFYHASLTDIAHRVDYSAVFAFSLFPIMYFLQRWQRIRKNQLDDLQKRNYSILLCFPFLAIWILLSLFTPKGMGSAVTLLLILTFFAFAFINQVKKPGNHNAGYLVSSIVSILVAILWFELDRFKLLCYPGSYFQSHALWNLFIGISAYYFSRYIRNEKNSAVPGVDHPVENLNQKI